MRFHLDLACLTCAGDLEITAIGDSQVTQTTTVAYCPACRLEHVVQVRLFTRAVRRKYSSSPAPIPISHVTRGPAS